MFICLRPSSSERGRINIKYKGSSLCLIEYMLPAGYLLRELSMHKPLHALLCERWAKNNLSLIFYFSDHYDNIIGVLLSLDNPFPFLWYNFNIPSCTHPYVLHKYVVHPINRWSFAFLMKYIPDGWNFLIIKIDSHSSQYGTSIFNKETFSAVFQSEIENEKMNWWS